MSKKKDTPEVAEETKVTTEVEETEAVAEVEETTEEVKEEKESSVYLGPSITHVVRHGNVFLRGELTETIENTIAEFPAMKVLFVPISGMAEAMKELKKESALANIYAEVAEKYK